MPGNFVHDGGGPERLDCRLIASGCSGLQQRAQKNEILQQLYYLLNVLPLQVPPLRERPDDVPDLVRFYAEWFPNRENLPYRTFSVAAQNRLRNHSWPGNIRELRNLVQRMLVLGAEGEVSAGEVEAALSAALAIEMIHAYSLVHDDLPAMDDDDLRRGRATVHRAFDEAAAILAGDALLALAFEVLDAHPDGSERAAARAQAERIRARARPPATAGYARPQVDV